MPRTIIDCCCVGILVSVGQLLGCALQCSSSTFFQMLHAFGRTWNDVPTLWTPKRRRFLLCSLNLEICMFSFALLCATRFLSHVSKDLFGRVYYNSASHVSHKYNVKPYFINPGQNEIEARYQVKPVFSSFTGFVFTSKTVLGEFLPNSP